ncbi:kelch-like protein 24 [Ptychodera flava]|uniref:kelch-like protein 24 n=1 Tax=Ptychodera flava TaxID=63121 RepID=UPI00396A6332
MATHCKAAGELTIAADDTFHASILGSLFEQSKEGHLCDVILQLGEHEFPVHACIVAANSNAFAASLVGNLEVGSQRRSSRRRNNVSLEIDRTGENSTVTPAIFRKLIEFMYTGCFEIGEDEIEIRDIREVAQVLRIPGMLEPFQELQRRRVFETLRRQRESGDFCDIELIVEGRRFPAHRCLLAAYSPYFEAMFCRDMREKQELAINLPFLNIPQAEYLIQYLYNGSITITADDVEDILMAADYFHITHMKEKCGDFLSRKMTCKTCLRYKALAETYSVTRLAQFAEKFIRANFVKVSRDDEVLDLPLKELITLISDDDIVVEIVEKGQLVETEACIFGLIVKWIAVDEEKRKKHFPKLLRCVRLHMISSYKERERILQHSAVKENPECFKIVVKAFQSVPLGHTLTGDFACMPRRGRPIDIITVVGATGSITSPTMISYVVEEDKWISLIKIPTVVQYTAAVFYDNRLYLCGGLQLNYKHRGHFGSASEISKACYCYDPMMHRWTQLPDMLKGLYHHNVIVCDEKLYALGGRHSLHRFAENPQCYDISSSTWTLISAPRRPETIRGEFLTHQWKGNIYLLSTESLRTSGTMDMYNTKADSWNVVVFPDFSPPPSQNMFFSLPHPSLPPSQMYVTDFFGAHYTFNLQTKQCHTNSEERLQTHIGEYIHNATVIKDKIFAFGSRVWVYDTPTEKWSKLVSYKGYYGKAECGLLQIPAQFLSKTS